MTKKYSPSNFLAMFCPRQDEHQNDTSYNNFLEIINAKPNLSFNTRSYVVHIAYAPSTQVAVDNKNQLTLILHGEIYNATNNQAEYLLREYQKQGLLFAKDINGSFAVLLVDQRNDSIALITDRLNSRKVFSSKYKGNYWLSSSLYLHPTADVGLDTVGVACYLASGVIYNNHTLFEGIRIPERACVHELARDGFHSKRYWSYKFASAYKNVDENKLRAELSELLIESVRIRLKDNPKVFLSLSGGYDSTGILGILHKLNVADVNCFSYALGEPSLNSDAYVAREMATSLGYNHKTIPSYKGDPLSVIKHNAQMGHGLAHFCDEVDAYINMASEFSEITPSILFVADMYYYSLKFYGSDISDVLPYVGIYDSSVLRPYSYLLDNCDNDTLSERWNEEYNQILKNAPQYNDIQDSKDYLYLDQRVVHTLLPWREYFQMPFIIVCNPYLDNNVLDFTMRLSPSQRYGKILYKQTLGELFPSLFQYNRALSNRYVPDWEQEFITHRHATETLILSQTSKLDNIIPPEAIQRILMEDLEESQTKHSAASLKTLTFKVAREIPGVSRIGNRLLSYFQGDS